MALKTTLRLPDRVAKRLKERAARDGRSVNETAVLALERGLDSDAGDSDEWWRALGDLAARPPKKGSFDLEAMRRRRKRLGIAFTREDAIGAQQALDEIRGDRF